MGSGSCLNYSSPDALHIRVGQVNLVDHRYNLQVIAKGQVEVGNRLRLATVILISVADPDPVRVKLQLDPDPGSRNLNKEIFLKD